MRWLRFLSGLLHAPGVYRSGIEAKAHAPILTVLRRQLGEAVSDVEQAVVTVCESFAGITQRARETVARAGALLGGAESDGKEGAGVEQLVVQARATFEHLLERMERGSELSLEVVRRMEELEASTREVSKAIAEIDAIAFRNKILSLNAKIEAVHVGELGAGFGVVADEISNQARRSTELTEQISAVVSTLRASVDQTTDRLRQFAVADRDRVAASRAEVKATLDALENAHWAMRAGLADTAERSEMLAAEIAHAVVGLQFQDRMSQRIGHVTEALEAMENALAVRGRGSIDQDRRRQEIAGRLESSYTMDAERAAAGSACVTAPESGGEVELF